MSAIEPEWIPVVSSNLVAIAYLPETQDEEAALLVEFHGGRIYRYAGVDPDTWEHLKSASSPGSYFASMIKNKYDYTRIS